mgnify:CR=1 FL=1
MVIKVLYSGFFKNNLELVWISIFKNSFKRGKIYILVIHKYNYYIT